MISHCVGSFFLDVERHAVEQSSPPPAKLYYVLEPRDEGEQFNNGLNIQVDPHMIVREKF